MYRAGDSHLLPHFKTWEELLSARLEQEEQLGKALRARQKEIKEHAGEHALQRRLFEGLVRLLDARQRAIAEEAAAAAQGTAAAMAAVGAGFDMVGGANVMTIE